MIMQLPSLRLDGQVALVTGASGGLGLYFAQLLAQAGAEVVLAARRLETLQAEVAALRAQGLKAHAVAMDVTDKASVVQAFADAETALGGRSVQLLVNNAGWSGRSMFVNLEEEEWDGVVDTSLKGTYLVTRELVTRLIAAGLPGSVVNIASILGQRVTASVSPYCAAKAGVIHLTKSLALELARHQVRVNALAPGYIATDMNRDFWETEPGKQMLKRIPQRRLGQPEELAGPLLLLLSDAGRFMTGAVITVDGGHVCNSI
ncbi:MAG: SDR family NAD(P)-dependent oxidoreductase [Fluviicoccus sp.]|uniref:SDR family NAD(P)-dependent oxidoreductase n=1 Tax=Fluviicoccus sp. TaxID=2003552 RepID=UPI002717BDBE|nr:SDR family NAD(P)-dependent oxidoreductase [Fluviicoccus sp.]MDO8331950.1 SDR family NAD(P)-dependent oxidoreductase [Fluviicoccus sp.]